MRNRDKCHKWSIYSSRLFAPKIYPRHLASCLACFVRGINRIITIVPSTRDVGVVHGSFDPSKRFESYIVVPPIVPFHVQTDPGPFIPGSDASLVIWKLSE